MLCMANANNSGYNVSEILSTYRKHLYTYRKHLRTYRKHLHTYRKQADAHKNGKD